jgi:plasmid maintenance system antidote protein VapI
MKSFKEKMESLNIKQDTKWKAEAIYRRDNKWLQYSAEIAARILYIIENDEELNQTKLAEALNVSRQQVSKILQGKENLTLETIDKISQALGVQLITFTPFEDLHQIEKSKNDSNSSKK